MGKIYLDGFNDKDIKLIVLEGENCEYVELDKKYIDTLIIDDIYNYYRIEDERIIDDSGITEEEQKYIDEGGTMLFGTKTTGKKIKVPYYTTDECTIVLKDALPLKTLGFGKELGLFSKFINYRNICHLYIVFLDDSSIMIDLPWNFEDNYKNYYQESEIIDNDVHLTFKEVSTKTIKKITPDILINSLNLEHINKIYLLGKYARGKARKKDTLVLCVDWLGVDDGREASYELHNALQMLYRTNVHVFDYNMYNTEDIDKKGLLIYSK